MKHPRGGQHNEEREGDFDREGTVAKERAPHDFLQKKYDEIDREGESISEAMQEGRSSTYHRPSKTKVNP